LNKKYGDHQNDIGGTFSWNETVAMAKKELIKRKVWNL